MPDKKAIGYSDWLKRLKQVVSKSIQTKIDDNFSHNVPMTSSGGREKDWIAQSF